MHNANRQPSTVNWKIETPKILNHSPLSGLFIFYASFEHWQTIFIGQIWKAEKPETDWSDFRNREKNYIIPVPSPIPNWAGQWKRQGRIYSQFKELPQRSWQKPDQTIEPGSLQTPEKRAWSRGFEKRLQSSSVLYLYGKGNNWLQRNFRTFKKAPG